MANPALLAQEARKALALVEQLELALAKSTGQSVVGVRSSTESIGSEAHRDIIADYYRQLGQLGEVTQQSDPGARNTSDELNPTTQ